MMERKNLFPERLSKRIVGGRCELDRLAATNKCLAQSNKSRTAREATNKRNRR